MFSALILLLVSLATSLAVTVAFLERAKLAREVESFIAGIEIRTKDEEGGGERAFYQVNSPHPAPTRRLDQLMDEAIQSGDFRLSVLAVSELKSRAHLARSRALLLFHGLSRIALLSGGGGAFVLVAAGNFRNASLLEGGAAVALGVLSSFSCRGLTASARNLARKYAQAVDMLARETSRRAPPPLP